MDKHDKSRRGLHSELEVLSVCTPVWVVLMVLACVVIWRLVWLEPGLGVAVVRLRLVAKLVMVRIKATLIAVVILPTVLVVVRAALRRVIAHHVAVSLLGRNGGRVGMRVEIRIVYVV